MEEQQQAEPEMTAQEVEEYVQALAGNTPGGDEKNNVHTFLNKVATAEDTTKLGNLKEEEVGLPKLPQRTYLDLALFCKDVANMEYFYDYFQKKAEILTSSSLSKDAKLISLAVMQRREFSQKSGTGSGMNSKKSWFGGGKKAEI